MSTMRGLKGLFRRGRRPTADGEVGIQAGQLVAGKYLVERVIGVGGMGVVVAARHVQLDGKVAIKVALPQTLRNADAVGQFVQEARAAARIKSDHVARVSD